MATQSSRRRTVARLALASLVVVATACGSANPASTKPGDTAASGASASVPAISAANSTSQTQPAAASQATALLNFTAAIVGGSQVNTASLLGKPVAFWFWAPG